MGNKSSQLSKEQIKQLQSQFHVTKDEVKKLHKVWENYAIEKNGESGMDLPGFEKFCNDVGNDDGNVNNSVNAILHQNDAIPDNGGDCNLAEAGDGGQFWSMGDGAGYVIVSFPGDRALEDNDTITVWELDDIICDNVGTSRADSYEVYVGNSDAGPNGISNSSGIGGNNWLSLGAAPGTGGVENFTVALP